MQPKHIAVIPDGNRRWAKIKKLSVGRGHKIAAEKTLPKLVERAIELKIEYFSFWAMSTDNFKKRSKPEIESLMQVLGFFLDSKINDFNKKGLRFKAIGDIVSLPDSVKKKIVRAEKQTENNTTITFIMAINYGGRDEITRAVNKLVKANKRDHVTRNVFGRMLDTGQFPDPDMIIRTGGDIRLSGFMLWQSEYSELFFTETLFPDFSPVELDNMVRQYNYRKRRFGK